jgi:hypothetical protein
MNTLRPLLLAAISLLVPLSNAFAQSDQQPPTAIIIQDDFSPAQSQWQPVSGTWSFAQGTYGNNSTNPSDITRITFYRDVHPAGPGNSVVTFTDFTVSARLRNSGTTDAHLVGLIYGFQDAQNYYEVVVSAIGSITMRTVMNGIAVAEAPAAHANIPRNQWFDVEVHWVRGVTSLKVNGRDIFTRVPQAEFQTGQVGLVTHGAVGRFDKMFLGVPFGDQPFLETFSQAPFVGFAPQSGQWSVVNGTYRNSAVEQNNITLAPIHAGPFPSQGDTFDYTFRARMLNPYGGSGNLIGIVFNYRFVDYTEVVFSPLGVASLKRFENGVVHTLATANYGGTRNVAFDVTLENSFDHLAIVVNGQRLFANVPASDVNPSQVPDGGVGLITHWAPGRFDNIEFNHGFYTPCTITFDQAPEPFWIVSGTWNANGGTLNNTSVEATDIVNPPCGSGTYTARLRNEFGASGNLVGLIYDYQAFSFIQGDYYEVTFSPTGVVQLNKIIEGVRYPVRTAAHNVPRNTWFTAQVIRDGNRTTVKVNGTTLVAGEIQAELHGSVGVVSHWTKGHFDNVTTTEFVQHPPSEL